MTNKVFAVVVIYNGKRWYDRCLGSLFNSEQPVDVVVIDNASSDDSINYIKEHFPRAFLIESKENLGFAKANNIGIRYAIDHGADYVFLLNQDAWIEKDTISGLVKAFDANDTVGIASPVHLNGSYTALDHGFVNYVSDHFVSDAYLKQMKDYYEIPFVNAAAWLINRQCIDTVGGFDTSLFKHYGEDENYCQRVLYHGFHIVVATRFTICHDREDRKEVDRKYDVLSNRTTYLHDRVLYGDIRVSFDFNGIRKKLKRKMWIKGLTGKRDSVKELKRKLSFFDVVEISRKINKKPGMNWL